MTSWPSITRAQVIANAKKGFGSGLNKVWYSQETFSGDYRADCSGFVCRALGLTKAVAEAHGVDWWGGMNTVSLVTSGALIEIGINDLERGDLAGELGPGTGGDGGHVYVFDEWFNQDPDDSRMWIYEQCGGTRGPIRSLRTWPYPGTCRAYRYAGIIDTSAAGGASTSEDDMTTRTSLSITAPQPAEWGKFHTLSWPQENTDPDRAHADGSFPGFVSPRSAYVDLDLYLMVEGMQPGDEYQVRAVNHTWKAGKGSVASSAEYLADAVVTSGAQAVRVQGSLYLAKGHHLYVELMPVRRTSAADAPAPRVVSGVWRIRQDG